MLHFLLIPSGTYNTKRDSILPDSNKNDGPDSVERVHKTLESPKTIENLESSADHDLGNIQNAIPSKYEVSFLRKKLSNKQKIIDNLSNIINYMHKNSNWSGDNFYKNTNGQLV